MLYMENPICYEFAIGYSKPSGEYHVAHPNRYIIAFMTTSYEQLIFVSRQRLLNWLSHFSPLLL